MSKRTRMTWAALDREAAAPPALPGYGIEDQDHPAHIQDDPDAHDYEIGTTSDFAEDVHPGPYGDSGPPALPGYGIEDQDHPAHQGQQGRQAFDVVRLVRVKAAKAYKLAKITLSRRGRVASARAIEDQAFKYMTAMTDAQLDSNLRRLGGGFMANDFEDEFMANDFDDEFMADDDEFMADDEFELMADDDEDEDDDFMAMMHMAKQRLASQQREILRLRRRLANQNDPDGDTLGADGKSEDEAKKEEAAASKQAKKTARLLVAMFDMADRDNDGFVMAEEWTGPKGVFAYIDRDRDGIVARQELIAGCEKLPEALREQCEKKEKGSDKEARRRRRADEDEMMALDYLADFDEEELAMLDDMDVAMDDFMDDGAMGCGITASDDEDEDDDVEAGKKARLKARKARRRRLAEEDEDDVDASDDEDEDDDVEAGKKANLKALKARRRRLAEEDEDDVDASDDEDGDSDKEASFFNEGGYDPMGLSEGGSVLTAADDEALRLAFAEGSDAREASLDSLLKPQGKKASQGVKTVGAVPKSAGRKDEISSLSDLWDSAPDVSKMFG